MIRVVVLAIVVALTSLACSEGDKNDDPDGSCLDAVYACFPAAGDCVLSSQAGGQVAIVWDDGSRVEGGMGLATFDAIASAGQSCFQRSLDGTTIVITGAGGQGIQVERLGSGATNVTCPGGTVEQHPADAFPSTAVGIDPGRLTGCRVAGICNQTSDCETGQQCCAGKCVDGERCPGACELDEHCGEGNRCCDGWCTSLPACRVPCVAGFQCDDGVFCNGLETCDNGFCLPTPPIACDDSVDCSQDACDEGQRACVYTADDGLCGVDQRCDPILGGCRDIVSCVGDPDCEDPDPCTQGTCLNGECEFSAVAGCCHADTECDDGLFCNGEESCLQHVCTAGDLPNCDDGLACTDDQCDSDRNTCLHQPDHIQCGAGFVCDPNLGCIEQDQCPNDLYEENDTRSTAAAVPANTPAACYMCPNDEDWYSFEINEVGVPLLIVIMDPAAGLLDVTVYNNAEEVVGELSPEGVAEGINLINVIGVAMGDTVFLHVKPEVGTTVTGDYLVLLQFDLGG